MRMEMRHSNRKLISLALILCLVLTMIPIGALAEGEMHAELPRLEPAMNQITIIAQEPLTLAPTPETPPHPSSGSANELGSTPEERPGSASAEDPSSTVAEQPHGSDEQGMIAGEESDDPDQKVEQGDLEESNPIQAAIGRDGFAYVRTSKNKVPLYTGWNLSQAAGTIKNRDSLLFAMEYIEREGAQDVVRVALSDGNALTEGYVRMNHLRMNVADAQAASGSGFYVGSHPIAVIEYVPAGVDGFIEPGDDEEETDDVVEIEAGEAEEKTEVGQEPEEGAMKPEITEAAQAIIDRIDALPGDLLDDVPSALSRLYPIRRAFFALSRSERTMVGNMTKLDALWSVARASMPAEARALADLVEWIAETRDMVMVTEAYALYESMGSENLAYVYNLSILLGMVGDGQNGAPVEEAVAGAEEPAIPEAAQAVIGRIAALREHQLNDVPTALSILYSIRQAYFALSGTERTLVGNISRLDEFWATMRSSMPADARELADMIERIAETQDVRTIAEAFAAYESMSALSREFVYNLGILLGMNAPDVVPEEVPVEEIAKPTIGDAAQEVIDRINALPDDLLNDVPSALSRLYSIRRAYFALSRSERAMVSNLQKLEDLWAAARAALPEDARALADIIEWISETQDLEKIPDALTACEFMDADGLAYVYNLDFLPGMVEEPTICLTVRIGGEVLFEGTPVTIVADIDGVPEGAGYDLQWQNDLSGEFQDVPGETGTQVTFSANERNVACAWRLLLTLHG